MNIEQGAQMSQNHDKGVTSVSDPFSLNPDPDPNPDPAKNLNPDLDPDPEEP